MTANAPRPGTVLAGKYRVDRVLGRGGMGFVVAATHLQIDEPVAVKFLHTWLAKDAELVLRFEREAKAARKIKSEHVVRILDVGTLEGGAPYLVMEYLEGTDLDALVQRGGRQPLELAIDYLLQAMEALAEAHVQGMVHRDLKPANLFVARRADGSPLVKVLDFGISKVTGHGGAELNMTKTDAKVLGSPLYMAPEQMRSLRTVDARTDIWALGVILYELLAGAPPFNGASMTELCAVILQDPAPPLGPTRPDVPVEVEGAIRRCLEKDPNGRFPNVAALAQALAPFASPSGRFSAERIAGVLRAASPGPAFSAPPPAPIVVSAPPLAPIVVSGPPPRPNATTSPKSWGDATLPAPLTGSPPVPLAVPGRRLMIGLLVGMASVAAIALVVAIVALRSKGPVTEIHYTREPGPKSSGDRAAGEPGDPHDDGDPDDEEPKGAGTTPKEARPRAEIVRIVPSGGNYGRPFDVTLSTRTPNATIHYTLDHSDPTPDSPRYTQPIHVDKTTLVKAIAVSPSHSRSRLRFESYLLFPNPIETPAVVDFGVAACGVAPKPQVLTVKNAGAATDLHVELNRGAESPFMASGDGPLPARGEVRVRVSPKPVPLGVDVLDGVSDVLHVRTSNGLLRDVTLTEIGTGPAFEVVDDGDIDFGDVAVGKKSPPQPVRIRSRGTVDAIVSLTTEGMGGFEVSPSTLVVRAGETGTVHVAFKPSGTAAFTGMLHVAHAAAHPGCTETAAVKLRGTATH